MNADAEHRDLLEEKRIADERFDDEVRAFWRFRNDTRNLLERADETVSHAR